MMSTPRCHAHKPSSTRPPLAAHPATTSRGAETSPQAGKTPASTSTFTRISDFAGESWLWHISCTQPPNLVTGADQLAPHLSQPIPFTQTATEQQKPRARHCARFGEPQRISDEYTRAWLRIMRARPNITFYAYTKEVDRFRRIVAPDAPGNFRWVFSLGGTQDELLDPSTDRVADVFPTEEAITEAGWHSQQASDLLAVLGPAPVGMSANRIPAFLKRLGGRRFSQWQAQVDAERAALGRPHRLPASAPDHDPPSSGGRTR